MTAPQPTVEQIAEIAKGLTKAQREAVWRDGAWSTVTARGLLRAGLLDMFARQTGENWVRLSWNPLGLALRQHLIEQGNRG